MTDDIANPTASRQSNKLDYPIYDIHLPFAEYIARSKKIITERRIDLAHNSKADLIINANSPYAFYADESPAKKRAKYGALLVHGLLDCPFSLKETAKYLQSIGIASRGILLPGHGTRPEDLLHISHHDWLQAVRYGIQSFQDEVDELFLIGYSTGAALALYHAMQNKSIAGLILLCPAIKIKAPVDIVVGWRYLFNWIINNNKWACLEKEIDYTKYSSVPFHAVSEVSLLTQAVKTLQEEHTLNTRMLMILSKEDETISSHSAIEFFKQSQNQNNALLLYSAYDHHYLDPRIETRTAIFPQLNIHHLSHISLPYSAENFHYGQHGDYEYASHPNKNRIYGAYNPLEEKYLGYLTKMGLVKKRQELTYNPDFDFMVKRIGEFITKSS